MFSIHRQIFQAIKRLVIVLAMGFVLLKPDVTIRLVLYFQEKSIEAIEAGWGCPAAFNKGACGEYDANRH